MTKTTEDFVNDAADEGRLNAEVERLAKLSAIKYSKERKAVAEQFGIAVSVLDEAVKQQRKKSAKAAKPGPTFDVHELQRTASHIIDDPNILDSFADQFRNVIAGEAANGKLLYLIATSRLLDKTMHAAVKGTSAGGKSEIRKRVLEFFPPENVISFTSLSEKALIYHDGDFAHKVLSMGEASATDEQNFQDYLLRELISEGRLVYPTVQKIGNELITVTIEKNGPVAFLVTTTKNKLHAENETRMLSLEIDDSEKQTKSVLGKVAQVEGLNHSAAQVDHKPWQDFQRWLERGERRVVVPFADVMANLIPPAAVRLRRDFGQVIRAIKAHALLHREQRLRDGAGQIVADITCDYEPVRKLMAAIIAEGSGVAVNKATVETIEAVSEATAAMACDDGASAQDVAKVLKLDKSAAWRRLSAARQEGFIVNLEVRKGMPGRYRTTGQKVEPINILPTAAELAERFETMPSPPTPPEPVQPCNRDEIAEVVLEDNGCTDGCNPVARCTEPVARVQPVASGLATDKSLDGNGKSPPVAGLHGFLEEAGKGDEDDGTIPPFLDRRPAVCAHCGQPGGKQWDYDGATIRLHPHCEQLWIAAYKASHRRSPGATLGSSL
jgi:hypothetical protein